MYSFADILQIKYAPLTINVIQSPHASCFDSDIILTGIAFIRMEKLAILKCDEVMIKTRHMRVVLDG
jgi:hypothetical protein